MSFGASVAGGHQHQRQHHADAKLKPNCGKTASHGASKHKARCDGQRLDDKTRKQTSSVTLAS